jgi:hypothetical protein
MASPALIALLFFGAGDSSQEGEREQTAVMCHDIVSLDFAKDPIIADYRSIIFLQVYFIELQDTEQSFADLFVATINQLQPNFFRLWDSGRS